MSPVDRPSAFLFCLAACSTPTASSSPTDTTATTSPTAPVASQTTIPAANGASGSPLMAAGSRAPAAGAHGGSSGEAGSPRADVAGTGGAPSKDDADSGMPPSAADPPAPSITVADKSAATDAWWSYTRAPSYMVVTSTVQVPMRDGTPIGCTLGRPAQNGAAVSGTFPGLVVEFTPYVLNADNNDTEAAFFSERGYNTLVCTMRGVGQSGGTWQHAFASQDGRDAHDLVEWLATQPFADGRVGQFGESYGGQTSYGAAVEQPPHLRAIAPMQPPSNLYDDVIYPGGIPATDDGTINNWPPIAELLSLSAISAKDEYAAGDAHPTFDAYWQERSLIGRHSAIQVPVLTTGGWQDGYFRSGAMNNIEGALERTWVIYGPWPHLPNVDLGECSSACVDEPLPSGVLLAWFDRWVMELKDAPIPEHPTFVSFENPKGASRGWRELSGWVPAGTNALTYVLDADGKLSDAASANRQPASFHEPSEIGVAFTTPPLAADHVLIGRVTLELPAKLSAPDANFYVQILDVDASDKETFVNDGFLEASHRDSHVTPAPAPVGEVVDYHIVVRPQHYRFAAGHRLRVRISSGTMDALVQPAAVDVEIETGDRAKLRVPNFAAAP